MEDDYVYPLNSSDKCQLFLRVLSNPIFTDEFSDRELFIMKEYIVQFTKGQISTEKNKAYFIKEGKIHIDAEKIKSINNTKNTRR